MSRATTAPGREPAQPARSRRTPAVRIAAGVALGVVAWCLVWSPLLGDQALMLLVGRDVVGGRHLYTEIFDAKQPGMYLFYGAADAVGGPVALVVASLLVLVATAVLLTLLVERRLASAPLRAWVPLVAFGVLILSLSPYDTAQTELLMCLPATAAVLLVAGRGAGERAERTARWGAFAAGLCLGLIVAFKTILVAVPGIAVLLLLCLSGRGWWVRLLAVCAGGLVVPAAVVAWLAARGDLDAALWTWFVYPGQVLEGADVRDPDRLRAAVSRFAVLMAPALLLAAWRTVDLVRRGRRGVDRLDLAMAAWLVAGIAAYAVQVWWSYYLLILLPPLVVLAVRQLDDVLTGRAVAERARLVALAGLAVLTLPLLAYGAETAARAIADGGGITAASREQIAERLGGYTSARREVAGVLGPDDTLFVLGDPRFQLIAQRPIPVTTNGWSAGVLPPQRWAALADELRAVRPDVVLVDRVSAVAVEENGAVVGAVLDELYDPVTATPTGIWYRLAPAR